MFNNIVVYQYFMNSGVSNYVYEDALKRAEFLPCGPTQDVSIGWVPPREENGALVETVGGELIMKLAIEKKSVPKSEIDKVVKAAAKKIEEETGRKPCRKAVHDLKEDALMALLPMAFPKRTDHLVWLCRTTGLLAIEASSTGHADTAISAIISAIDGITISKITTTHPPSAAMREWLINPENESADDNNFTVGRECELKSTDEEKSVAKFSHHNLNTADVRIHLKRGKEPVKLGLTWADRVSFVLTKDMALKKIEFLDTTAIGQKEEDAFDADVAIATGELQLLLTDLIGALGGHFTPEKVE